MILLWEMLVNVSKIQDLRKILSEREGLMNYYFLLYIFGMRCFPISWQGGKRRKEKRGCVLVL